MNPIRNKRTTDQSRRGGAKLVVLLVSAFLVSGCTDFPKDPEKTFERILSKGVVRIGVIQENPWAYRQKDGTPTGLEVEMAEDFAETIPARPRWQFVSEAEAVEKLEKRELDLVIGGFTMDSPRRKTLGFTRSYLKIRPSGKEKAEHHVLAVPRGENRWLVELEQFLREQRNSIRSTYERRTGT